MLIFIYGGPDSSSDIGHWRVAITAPNREIADKHIVTHLKSKGRADAEKAPTENFIRSRMLDRDGILYSNVEENRDVDQTDR